MTLYDPEKIPDFYQQVYQIVSRIPRGKVATYGQIAALAGRPFAARAVGTAMKRTPEYLNLPCHRVISQSGRLTASCAFGGPGRLRKLLEEEGIGFRENGSVDMKHYRWRNTSLPPS